MRRFLSLLAPLTLLTACAVGPDFTRPAAPGASSYDSTPLPGQTDSSPGRNGAAQNFATGKDIPADWWHLFQSVPLNTLIVQSIKTNPDIAAAEAALREAEENVQAGGGELYPTVGASFSTTRQKTAGASNGGKFPGSIYTLHNASVDVSYGVDLFGASRRDIEKLEAVAESQQFQMQAAWLSLTSNVVTAAIQEASLRGQITTTQKIIDEEAKQLDLLKQQLDLGSIAKTGVLAQATTLAQEKAQLPALEQQLAQVRHELSALAGKLPNEDVGATFDLDNLKLPEELPVSLPSSLVAQRPDIRAAEANLHAASAAIGVAEAARLPQLTLSADIGSVANSIDRLFSPGGGFWSAGFSIAQVVFDGGTLKHKQLAAMAEYDRIAAIYRKTVITAFQQVADTLRALQSDAAALRLQIAAEQAAADSLKLSRDQFNAGSISYIEFLNAEQVEEQTRIALVKAEAQRFADTAALFQALGGGWWNRTDRAQDHIGPNGDILPWIIQ